MKEKNITSIQKERVNVPRKDSQDYIRPGGYYFKGEEILEFNTEKTKPQKMRVFN